MVYIVKSSAGYLFRVTGDISPSAWTAIPVYGAGRAYDDKPGQPERLIRKAGCTLVARLEGGR